MMTFAEDGLCAGTLAYMREIAQDHEDAERFRALVGIKSLVLNDWIVQCIAGTEWHTRYHATPPNGHAIVCASKLDALRAVIDSVLGAALSAAVIAATKENPNAD